MDTNALLLLGLLRTQRQHGYQLHDFIERNLSRVTALKKPTAYALLERLRESGLIESREEREGNRPPRRVYAITPAGEARFLELLRGTLSSAPAAPAGSDVGLMFLDALQPDERDDLLRERLAELEARLAALRAVPPHAANPGVNLAVERQIVLLEADRAWLEGVLGRLGA